MLLYIVYNYIHLNTPTKQRLKQRIEDIHDAGKQCCLPSYWRSCQGWLYMETISTICLHIKLLSGRYMADSSLTVCCLLLSWCKLHPHFPRTAPPAVSTQGTANESGFRRSLWTIINQNNVLITRRAYWVHFEKRQSFQVKQCA